MLPFDVVAVPILSAVAGASIRAVVLAAIAALVIGALRKRSAPLQHALWTVVTVAMLALPFVTRLLPPLQLPGFMQRLDWPTIARVPSLRPVVTAPHSAQRTEPIVIQVTDAGVVAVNPANAARPLARWPTFVAALYICGVVAVLLRVGVGLFLAERLGAQSSTLRDTRANELLQELASVQRLSFPWPRVYASDAVSVPLVLGAHGSAIVLPSQWREWDDWKLRAVLSHELTHLRRRDYPILLLAALNKAVFWFHPLAWWLETRLSGLCEQASDDAAVQATGDPVRYARVVLDLANDARNAGRRLLRPVSALSIAGASNVSRRIDRLLEERTWSSGVFPYRSWLTAALATVPLVTLLAAAQVSSISSPSKGAGDVAPSWQWIQEGFSTTAEQARELEERLAREPDDLAARAKLIAYYLYNVNPNAVTQHAMWVIEHHPESELAGSAPVSGGYIGDPTAEEAKRRQVEKSQLWLRQAARYDRNARVLGHAGAALMMTDPVEAERLLLKARELDRANDKWVKYLAGLYTEALLTDSYQTAGVTRLWRRPVDPGFAARVRAEVDRSQDIELVGSVGTSLVTTIVHVHEFSPGQETQIAQARRSISEYVSSLLKRAITNEPARAEWADSLRKLNNGFDARNVSSAAVHESAASANASGKPSASESQISPAQQKEMLISSTPPVYPPLARQARIQGVVRLRVRIGTDGRVKTTALVYGHPLLVASAEDSARTYVYRPTVVNGQAVEVETVVDVNFSLSGQ